VTYEASPEQIAAVVALDPPERTRYLVKRVADWNTIWGLRNKEGWVSSRAADSREAFPVWPNEEYARLCIAGDWSTAEPAEIELEDFMKAWLPGLAKEGKVVAVFPTPESGGAFLASAELNRMLRAELERIE
jgi:hypothetical protein